MSKVKNVTPFKQKNEKKAGIFTTVAKQKNRALLDYFAN